MKKIKLSLLILFIGMASFIGAQNSSFSIKGGLNISNFYGDNLNNQNMKTGFHVGIGADFEFAPNSSLISGLFFSTKGAKYKNGLVETNVTAGYLQLPVHIAFKIDVMPGTKVVFHAGPYAAYGVGGKMRIGTLEMNTFDDDLGFKPFDAGLGLGVGAEFGRILVDIGWDLGLTNISRVSSMDVKNQNAYFSLGYIF